MIKSLKRKFITTIMFFVTAIVLALIFLTYFIPMQQSRTQAKTMMEQVMSQPSGTPMQDKQEDASNQMPSNEQEDASNQTPSNEQEDTSGQASSSTLKFSQIAPQNGPKNNMFTNANMIIADFNEQQELINIKNDRQDLYDDDFVENFFLSILKQKNISDTVNEGNNRLDQTTQLQTFGVKGGFYYAIKKTNAGYIFMLMDNSLAFSHLKSTLLMTVLCCMGAWIVLLILSICLVNRMVKPVETAIEKQRQFISDAGHELKTPVAVISANADVLSEEIGENQWLGYIHSETTRMDKLIKNLMALAKLEDQSSLITFCNFSISDTILGATLPFESLAFEKGMTLDTEVTENLMYHGCKEHFEQLAGIMLSNAIKYGNQNDHIRVTLKKEHKHLIFSVYNSGEGISKEEQEHIFDRFYRVNKERSRKEGNYGLGLAIAASIAQEHHGKIHVDSVEHEYVTFTFRFPLK